MGCSSSTSTPSCIAIGNNLINCNSNTSAGCHANPAVGPMANKSK